MDFTFDPAKDAANRAKHGVPLLFGARVFDGSHIVLSSARPIDGEVRFKAIGLVDGKLWTAVHLWRDGTIRLIPVRRSNGGERRGFGRGGAR